MSKRLIRYANSNKMKSKYVWIMFRYMELTMISNSCMEQRKVSMGEI